MNPKCLPHSRSSIFIRWINQWRKKRNLLGHSGAKSLLILLREVSEKSVSSDFCVISMKPGTAAILPPWKRVGLKLPALWRMNGGMARTGFLLNDIFELLNETDSQTYLSTDIPNIRTNKLSWLFKTTSWYNGLDLILLTAGLVSIQVWG